MKESFFQFSKPVISVLNYSINEEVLAEEAAGEKHLHTHFDRRVLRMDGKPEAVVELVIEIGCDEKSINVPFRLSLTIGAAFRWNEDIADDAVIQSLLNLNAPALLLSYARPVISNITSNSIGVYDIPFVNFEP